MRAAVLLYHSNNVSRNDYAGNDHIALMQDLRLLAELHIPVVSLHRLVDAFDAILLGQQLQESRKLAGTAGLEALGRIA